VREAGATISDAPLLSNTATLLSNASYPDGCYEIAVAATAGNGFSANGVFSVFATLAIDGQNPSGFVGSFSLDRLIRGSDSKVILSADAHTGAVIPSVTVTDAVTLVNGLANDVITALSLATDAVAEIRDAIHPVAATTLANIPFVFKDTNGSYVTGASGINITRSIDGAAFAAVSGSTVAEVGNGLYEIDASAADMTGGKITFRITGTGGTPLAPVDRFVTIVTGTGV
jgi:hypothetical protein